MRSLTPELGPFIIVYLGGWEGERGGWEGGVGGGGGGGKVECVCVGVCVCMCACVCMCVHHSMYVTVC